MRERERKRLRIAQSIQRELVECEVRQQELETRAVVVEKKMASVEAGKRSVSIASGFFFLDLQATHE